MPALLPLAFIAEQMPYGREYPFDQFGSGVLAMFPPRILPTPSLLDEVGEMLENRENYLHLSQGQYTEF